MKAQKRADLRLFGLISFAAVSLLGTLLHFAYDLFGGGFTALFSGVNESTWEHMKLLFFPMLLAAFIGSFILGSEYGNYWLIKLCGILTGLVLIPMLFYTLSGMFGKTPDLVNIAIFFISAGAGYIFEISAFEKNRLPHGRERLSVIILLLLALLFFLFTFMPPDIPLFTDPVDGSRGI